MPISRTVERCALLGRLARKLTAAANWQVLDSGETATLLVRLNAPRESSGASRPGDPATAGPPQASRR